METHSSPPPPLTGFSFLASKGLPPLLSPLIPTPPFSIPHLSLNTWSCPMLGSKNQFSVLNINPFHK